MPFQIIRNDITKVTADAIVNTANPRPVIGGGTDSAIYQAAGAEQLLAERQKIGEIARGEAAVTPAFDLKAKYIIHTVGPAWIDGKHGERETLHSCYEKVLNLAAGLSCQSIAFPLIATGVYGFPKDEALNIALAEIGKFLLTHDMDVTLVVFDRKALQLSRGLVGSIDEYIDEHAVGLLRTKEYGRQSASRRRRLDEEICMMDKVEDKLLTPQELKDMMYDPEWAALEIPDKPKMAPKSGAAIAAGALKRSLEEILSKREDTFQQRLFKLIDERHLTDPEVYHKANIDRKVFSKIRCNPNYHPKKKTAVAFAIALELDMGTMQDLLSRAGFAISPSSKFDLIISYFINQKIYDIFEINAALFQYGEDLLGV